MIIEPSGFDKEAICELPTPPGADSFAVSGYAHFFTLPVNALGGPAIDSDKLTGDEDSDSKWVDWTVRMVVGPKLRAIRCVSPLVFVGGFSFNDSDEADDSGWHIDSVTWDTVGLTPPEDHLERLRIEAVIRVRGGKGFGITKLGYHAVLVGIH